MQLKSKHINLPENYTVVTHRRVLLLEDNEAFKDFLIDYLESHFFDVTAVESGVDGVREVMKADFDVILCDMMMPTLPGDMFYIAVERLKPNLCSRFIFMTGLRGDPKIGAFIKSVKGTMLSKPFHIDDLAESIRFIESKTAAEHDQRETD